MEKGEILFKTNRLISSKQYKEKVLYLNTNGEDFESTVHHPAYWRACTLCRITRKNSKYYYSNEKTNV